MTMAMRSRSHKLRYLMVGVVLFAMSWLGYWISYISDSSDSGLSAISVAQGQRMGEPLPFEGQQHIHKAVQDLRAHHHQITSVKLKEDPPIKAWNDKWPEDPRKVENIPSNVQINKDLLHNSDSHSRVSNKTVSLSRKKGTGTRKSTVKPLESLDYVHNAIEMQSVQDMDDSKALQEAQPILKPDGSYYQMIHQGRASKVPGNIHERLKSMPDSVDGHSYIFISDRQVDIKMLAANLDGCEFIQ